MQQERNTALRVLHNDNSIRGDKRSTGDKNRLIIEHRGGRRGRDLIKSTKETAASGPSRAVFPHPSGTSSPWLPARGAAAEDIIRSSGKMKFDLNAR